MLIFWLQIYLTMVGSRGHHRGRRTMEPETTMVETEPNELSKVISGLRPYSLYTLAVTVFNSKGDGPPSETVTFRTPEGGEKEKKTDGVGWGGGKHVGRAR